jgi:hypothetical protein
MDAREMAVRIVEGRNDLRGLHNFKTGSESQLNFCRVGTACLSLGMKWPERKSGHLPNVVLTF